MPRPAFPCPAAPSNSGDPPPSMNNTIHFLALILATIVALFPVINPLAAAPVFLTITEGDSPHRRLQQLRRACFYMVAILVSFLVGGTFIMNFFGISIPGLRIAGGLLVVGIGWNMLTGSPDREPDSSKATDEARAKPDISFSPLAMPMLSGPGSIAATIGCTSLASRWFDYVAIILGILAVAGASYAILRISHRIVGAIGVNGTIAMTKIMGFLLVCIGIQFVVNGVVAIATDPVLIQGIRNALQ